MDFLILAAVVVGIIYVLEQLKLKGLNPYARSNFNPFGSAPSNPATGIDARLAGALGELESSDRTLRCIVGLECCDPECPNFGIASNERRKAYQGSRGAESYRRSLLSVQKGSENSK